MNEEDGFGMAPQRTRERQHLYRPDGCTGLLIAIRSLTFATRGSTAAARCFRMASGGEATHLRVLQAEIDKLQVRRGDRSCWQQSCALQLEPP